MQFRPASPEDLAAIAAMNLELIRDEGHRNRMSLGDLGDRLARWLEEGHEAVLFEAAESPAGYALYRRDPEWIYLRQFFVKADHRRRGVGREALAWLFANPWAGRRVRLDVLVGNRAGIAFWRAADFADYCITMEREPAGNQPPD